MNLSLTIYTPRWVPVFTIPKGTVLVKGRKESYWVYCTKASEVEHQFICYGWFVGNDICYCGSVARNYQRGGYKSNLEGRVHNYLQNHQVKDNGRMNTNKMVFDNIVVSLSSADVTLSYLTFDYLTLGDEKFSFDQYSANPDMIHAVEQLLICTYKAQELSGWNRTPVSNAPEVKVKKIAVGGGSGSIANKIRAFIIEEIVNPAKKQNLPSVHIVSKDIHSRLGLTNSYPAVCQVLDGKKLWEQAGLVLTYRIGPKSGATSEWDFDIVDM